jgi:hypothetical protein
MEASETGWSSSRLDPAVVDEVRAALDRLAHAPAEDEAIDSAHALHELICYAAVTVEEETVPAVADLYRMVGTPDFRWKHFALQILDTIAAVDGVLASASPLKSRVLQELQRGVPLVRSEEHNPSRDVRGAAVLLLATLSRNPAGDFERFRRSLLDEDDPVVQADLALAATMCAWQEEGPTAEEAATGWSEAMLTHPNPAVRFRVGQYLVNRQFRWSGGDLDLLVASLTQVVLSKGLFRMEYM